MLKLAIRRRPYWSSCRARVVTSSAVIMAPKEKRSGQQPRSAHYSSHIKVLNVDNATASPSVLLFFDKDRFLFNAGEGIQRHFIEHKQRLKRVTHVLATRVSTDTLGGLSGLLLSQADPGVEAAVATCVTAPPGLTPYVDAFRMYAAAAISSVNELGPGSNAPISAPGRVTITPLLLTPSTSSNKQRAAADAAAAGPESTTADASGEPDGTQEPAAKKPRHEAPAAAVPADQVPAAAASAGHSRGSASVQSSSEQPTVACYVCQLATIPGKFDPRKAAQLGVPRGPLYGELQRGKSVTAVNGRVVQPHEVMDSPTMPGPCLIIVDCPSLNYLAALQSNATLQQLQQESAQQQPQASGGQQPTGGAAAVVSGASAGAANGAPQASSSSAEGPVQKRFVLVHLGPSDVVSSAEYSAWCDGFGAAADQLFVSSDSQCCSTTRRAAQLQAQLNLIEPEVFSLQGLLSLKEQATQQQQGADVPMQDASGGAAAPGGGAGGDGASPCGSAAGVHCKAVDGAVFKLVPARLQGLSLDAATQLPPDLDTVQAEVRDNHPQVMQLLQEYAAAKAAVVQQERERPAPQLHGINRQSCAVTPLGTCSACPSNHRNVSAYYMDLFERGGLLMDCGEDTMGQLERRFGRAEAERRIQELHAVWVSHMHADHHNGLYPLLLRRQALLQKQCSTAAATAAAHGGSAQAAGGSDIADGKDQSEGSVSAKPLLIMGPFPLFRVLCQYSKVLPLSFTFLPNHFFFSPNARQPPAEALAAYEAVKAAAGLAVLQPFPVQHVAHSSGLQVQATSGWKVVFSGDTRPCQAVIDAAKDATLLVHEATFEDELLDEAIAKKHSTTAEALGVAAAAGTYRTLLTHFSTRYPKIPVLKPPADAAAAAAVEGAGDGAQEEDGSNGGSDLAAVGSVLVAFDLMTVNLADLPWMPKMLPVLDELFKEEAAAYQDDDAAEPVE